MSEHEPPDNWQNRKTEVLTRATPSRVLSMTHAVVLKDEDVFFVTNDDGTMPLEGEHGYGLYFEDCRFLNGYAIELGGVPPEMLTSTARSRHEGIFELTNPDLQWPDGRRLTRNEIGIRFERELDGAARAVQDSMDIHNYSREPIDLEMTLSFRAEFEDLFVVRGLLSGKRGDLHPPSWEGEALHLVYDGKDGLRRTTTIRFSRPPDGKEGARAFFRVNVPPGGRERLDVTIALSILRAGEPPRAASKVDQAAVKRRVGGQADAFGAVSAHVDTDSLLVNLILDRAFADLLLLRTPLGDDSYYAAGVPWFVTLFGRDSLITALFMLPYHPGIAEDTLRLLARHQGTEVNRWRDEEPGKILHELRVGELAHIDEIPHTPFYGTIDATPLFLILLARHASWTGRLDLFRELLPNVEAALAWMSKYGEHSGIDGYLSYGADVEGALVNQGWKDSGDGIVDEEGRIVSPPVALVEVQAYAYAAKMAIAEICERVGDSEKAAALRREAGELRARFNRDFWMETSELYALALTGGGPARVRSSNPGHALWAGIADEDKARKTAEMLMSEGMYSGWGVRTLAREEKGYNPISYHRGTVWPHDNALLAAGLRRYGLDREAFRIFEGVLGAAMSFPMYQLPEVWSGFSRADYGVPVRYPVACHPQAWAAGSLPSMLASLLGLEVDGFERRLRIVRPILAHPMRRLELRGLAVGEGRADLEFRRPEAGPTEVRVLGTQGDVDIVVEPCKE